MAQQNRIPGHRASRHRQLDRLRVNLEVDQDDLVLLSLEDHVI